MKERVTFTKVDTDYVSSEDKFTRMETKDGVSMPLDLLREAVIEIRGDYRGTGDYWVIQFRRSGGWERFQVKESPLDLLKKE